MDSRLLNVLHDDPFDASFNMKYDNDTNFWATGSDTMGMQLTETLHGILPIAATEAASGLYVDDYQLVHKDDHSLDSNALIYDTFTEEHLSGGGIGAIEIVTVNPNSEMDSDSDDDDAILRADVFDDEDAEFDNRSTSTFRTRTDSSSIGDYESHSSDYEDEDYLEDEQLQADYKQQQPMSDDVCDETGLVLTDDLILDTSLSLAAGSKTRTISTNTIGSDVDGLGVAIDEINFDLADFITKDDFYLATLPSKSPTNITTANATAAALSATQPRGIAVSAKLPHSSVGVAQLPCSQYSDSDSDSDVIVDVETVEAVETEATLAMRKLLSATLPATAPLEDDDVAYVDNVRGDPSWSPPNKEERKKHEPTGKELKTKTIQPTQKAVSANTAVQPSKRQCSFLRGGKAASAGGLSVGKQAAKKIPPAHAEPVPRKVGMGRSSKNLAFLKHDSESITQLEKPTESTQKLPQEQQREQSPQQQQAQRIQEQQKQSPQQLQEPGNKQLQEHRNTQHTVEETLPIQITKRKLNLDEYKKRRSDNILGSSNNIPNTKVATGLNALKADTAINGKCPITPMNSTHKHSEAVTSIVKSLKAAQQQSCQPPATDPITVARNKVLRMQELKRAQQLKIIDSAVSAKVPRVTKLLPLKDIMKDNYVMIGDEMPCKKSATQLKQQHTDYEEIIIVSASCNTDISIPPLGIFRNQQLNPVAMRHVNDASRSLLKSSVLLYNISNTVQKAQATENGRISTNSLIASIQDTVVKQTLPMVEKKAAMRTAAQSATITKSIKVENGQQQQHGEDKIIMHLHKDRVRQRTACIATQTDFQPEFLTLFPAAEATAVTAAAAAATTCTIRRPKRRAYRQRKRQQHSHSHSEDSDASDVASMCSYRSRSRSHSGGLAESCSSSAEHQRDATAASAGGYSSRSSRRHRSSISSSYSECERVSRQRQRQRQRRTSHKQKQRRSRKYTRSRSSSSTSSSSSTLSDYSGRSGGNRQRSRSRTRSRSPLQSRWDRRDNKQQPFTDRNVSQPAVEERRIVYVGRIEQETTKEMLRRKFLAYGPINQITIHYKETGMKYGFVTYERSQDAFRAIDTGMRDSQISMYDISFGGRRAFCRATYADLDNAGINTYHSYVFPKAPAPVPEEDSFEALLLKVKAKMNASKTSNAAAGSNNTNQI